MMIWKGTHPDFTPAIWVALTDDGDVEAMFRVPQAFGHGRVVIDRRTGDLIDFINVKEDSENFRWLIRAAREHINQPRPEEYV